METSSFFESLYNYYNRNQDKMPPIGLSNGVPIKTVVVIDEQGKFVRLVSDNSELDEKGKPRVKRYDNVPFDVCVTSGVKAHFLYGKYEYFFPVGSGKKGMEKHDAFMAEIKTALDESEDKADLQAILDFYANGECDKAWNKVMAVAQAAKDEELSNAKNEKSREEIEKKQLTDYVTGDFTFQFHGRAELVIEDLEKHFKIFKNYYDRMQKDNFCGYGIDSVTGEYGKLVSVFPSKSMQATLIGFNNLSSSTHGYEQMGNCPMSVETAFKISSAFDYLRNDRKHNFVVGKDDAVSSLVFWSASCAPTELPNDELDDILFGEVNKVFSGKENEQSANENDKQVRSVFNGAKHTPNELNSTYYVASIVCPSKGTIFMSSFKSGKLSELYDNLEKYQQDFKMFDERFVTPRQVLETCFKRDGKGSPVTGEADSKKHINMRRDLLLAAIFGGKYDERILAELIDRIYRECSLEYRFMLGEKGVNRNSRIACVRAFAAQNHELDEFKFERDLGNLPYQTGAFYGVCEAIRRKYSIKRGTYKPSELWKVMTTEFRKGLLNQTSGFIVGKLKQDMKVLAKELPEDERNRLIGEYKKEQVWTTVTKPNGVVTHKGEWKITHDTDKKKWGELDWAIYRMESLSDQSKGYWTLDDRAMYLLGFYRKFRELTRAESNAK